MCPVLGPVPDRPFESNEWGLGEQFLSRGGAGGVWLAVGG